MRKEAKSKNPDVLRKSAEEEAFRRGSERLEILSETAGKLLATDRPQDIVNELCTRVMTHLDCHVFFNFLADEEKNRLHLNTYAGIPEAAAKEIEWLDYGTGVCGTVARDGQRMIAENIPENPDPKTDLVSSYGVKAYACHPLIAQNKVIGTLSFGTRSKTAFTDDDIALMKTVADQVSIAMERIKLLNETHRHAEDMEIRVEKRTSRLKFLNERLAAELSKRKKGEKIIRQQSEILDSLFQYTITPLVLLDAEFNFIRVNEAYARACARDTNEFLGHNHFELYPHEENEAIFKRVIETKVPYQAVAKAFSFPDHPEWGVTYWDWTLTPLLDETGDVGYLIFALNNVTERKEAEERLQESEHKYRMLIEQAVDGIVLLDRDLRFVDVNTTACEMTGFSRDELLKLTALDLYHQDELGEKPLRLDEVLAGKTVIMERKATKKDGSTIEVEISAKLIQGDHIQAIVRDITERKNEERRGHLITELLELFAKKASRKDYLGAVVQLIHNWTHCRHVGIRIVDKKGYVPYVAYTGFSEEFMRLENMISLDSDMCACIRVISGKFEPQDIPVITPAGSFRLDNSVQFAEKLSPKEMARFRGNCIRSGYTSIAVIPIRYHERPLGAVHIADEKEGMVPLNSVQFIESTVAPLIGEAIYRFSTEEELERHRNNLQDLVKERTAQLQETNEELGREIATRKHAEEELKELTEELRRSNTDLEQFAYAASHDLQEPLRVVAGFVKLLEKRYRDGLDEKAHEFIDYAVDGVKRMQMLIKDLLAYSQLGTKGKTFTRTHCAVALEQAIYNLQASIEENGAEVTYDSLPTVMADTSQLSRLFQNLISNAIKFRGGEQLRIHISAERRGGEWVFSVRDNGIGIDPKYFERIFVIFQRLHTREEYEGTGIGLSVCKKIVERHGGRIWVESEVRKGSTFYFTIPAPEYPDY
jgi:PAS domain S-box-containing protein